MTSEPRTSKPRGWAMHERLRNRARLAAASIAVIAAMGIAPLTTAFMQVPDEPSPESGTAQVVAQGVVDIGDGEMRWQVASRTAQPPANASNESSELGFLTVDSGVMLVEDLTSGIQHRLPAGEAMLTRAGDEQLRIALGSEDAAYRELVLVDAQTSAEEESGVIFTSENFAGLGGRHDLDLLHDILGPGLTTTVPASGLPSLVVILAGSADVATEAGDVVSLGPGEAVALTGPLVVTSGENGAAIAAVHVGPAVPRLDLAQVAGTPAAGRVVETPVDETEEPEGSPVAAVATELPAVEVAADPDEDGDGLTTSQEAEAGTDPALVDTDEDGLTDGQEALEFGTNPLMADTDGDGILDGDEVAQGTNPLDGIAPEAAVAEEVAPVEEAAPAVEEPEAAGPQPTAGDSEGDGLEDAIEFELGTDPFDVDTDDDGLTDGDEYYVFQTGTRNPDTDGDGILDGDEAANGTDPNNPASS